MKAGNRDTVRTLLKSADVNAPEVDGTTALHWSVRANDLETTRLLLGAGARADQANRYGVTPLSLAALNGNAAVMDALIKAGADPAATVSNGQTMLMIAARSGNPDAMNVLLARRVDVNAREQVLGETALIWAASENHAEAITLLAKNGADVNARSNPLTFPLAKFGDGKSARFTVLPRGGWTPLMYAARQGAAGAARALAETGADLNLTDPDGTSALVLAIINAHYDLAAMLIDKGANPNVGDSSGMAALYAAVDMNTLDETPGRPAPKSTDTLSALGLMTRLLDRGANPNAQLAAPLIERVHNNGDGALGAGATPLMRAAKKGDIDAMRVLVDHGADVNVTMKNGATVLMFVVGPRRPGPVRRVRRAEGHRRGVHRRREAVPAARRERQRRGRGRADGNAQRRPAARRCVHRLPGRQRRPAGREGQTGPAAPRPRARRRGAWTADRARERRGDLAEADELQ